MIFFNSQKNQSSGLASNVNTPFFSSFINFEKYIDGKFRPEGSFCDISSGIDCELPKNKEFANYLVQLAEKNKNVTAGRGEISFDFMILICLLMFLTYLC